MLAFLSLDPLLHRRTRLCPHSLPRGHPTSFGPLVFSTQVHRKAGSFFTRRTFSLCPFLLLFYLFLSHTTHVPFSFSVSFFFPSPSPFSVTFFHRSFLRRFCLFFLFLVLVLTLFLFLFGFFLAATVVRNSNRGSIWRHPSWAGRHNCGRVDHSLVASRLFSLPLFLSLSLLLSTPLVRAWLHHLSSTFLAAPLPLFRSRFLIFFRLGLIYCRLCRVVMDSRWFENCKLVLSRFRDFKCIEKSLLRYFKLIDSSYNYILIVY